MSAVQSPKVASKTPARRPGWLRLNELEQPLDEVEVREFAGMSPRAASRGGLCGKSVS